MEVKKIDSRIQEVITSEYREVDDWKEVGPFCVDGRDGSAEFAGQAPQEHLFVQALGGSLLIATIDYLIDESDKNFSDVRSDVIQRLQKEGFGIGIHYGSHRHGESSDCGFADNLPKIIARVEEKKDEIGGIINSVADDLIDSNNKPRWEFIASQASKKSRGKFETGESIVFGVLKSGANVQTLEGDHAEVAAVVNLAYGTTLDTRNLVSSKDLQAFNLDLWCVLEQARALGLDEELAKLSTLALYVATEMVLVEDKKNYRLPIIINS